jgi:hypothetical protein
VVVREESGRAGALCIPQAQHAAISGQIARAWGNERFAAPEPREQVCLAAARHDDGMEGFDADPLADPETGLPLSFMRMPLDAWLQCWRMGPSLVAADSPYAGALVSLHGDHLLGYRRLDPEDEQGRRAIAAYRSEQRRLRSEWLAAAEAELGSDAGGLCEPAAIERNRKLIEIWDAMSLAVSMPRLPDSFDGVPASGSSPAIEMRALSEGPGEGPGVVDPWPFGVAELGLEAEGRRLRGPFADREQLRAALAEAQPATLSVKLVPPEGGRALSR